MAVERARRTRSPLEQHPKLGSISHERWLGQAGGGRARCCSLAGGVDCFPTRRGLRRASFLRWRSCLCGSAGTQASAHASCLALGGNSGGRGGGGLRGGGTAVPWGLHGPRHWVLVIWRRVLVAGVLPLVSYTWSPQPTECRTWADSSPPTQLEDDLLHPNPALEKKKHKLKRLVQSPNSYFMDVKCPGARPPRSSSSSRRFLGVFHIARSWRFLPPDPAGSGRRSYSPVLARTVLLARCAALKERSPPRQRSIVPCSLLESPSDVCAATAARERLEGGGLAGLYSVELPRVLTVCAATRLLQHHHGLQPRADCGAVR